ncbi:hypothetical protein PM082_023336 [Marasmius tenuissimus]|nr:hypothetical protein PM082_023336 [Marasmius tenuissimus]
MKTKSVCTIVRATCMYRDIKWNQKRWTCPILHQIAQLIARDSIANMVKCTMLARGDNRVDCPKALRRKVSSFYTRVLVYLQVIEHSIWYILHIMLEEQSIVILAFYLSNLERKLSNLSYECKCHSKESINNRHAATSRVGRRNKKVTANSPGQRNSISIRWETVPISRERPWAGSAQTFFGITCTDVPGDIQKRAFRRRE